MAVVQKLAYRPDRNVTHVAIEFTARNWLATA